MDLPTESVQIDETQPDQSGETQNDDGTTTILLDSDKPPTSDEHIQNLAESLPDDELSELARRYLDLIEDDIQGRKVRDDQYSEGLKKTGISEPAPGGANFNGASRVTHPVLAEAYIDFSASAIKELFPPNGPVRSKIEGQPTHEKTDKANRKSTYMNWQLMQEIREYRGELERLLTQLPAGGTQFLKIYHSEDKGRTSVEFVPIDDFILPYNAKNFFDAQRKFHRMHLDAITMDRMVASGLYRDWELPKASGASDELSKTAKQIAKIEGKSEANYSDDIDRTVYEGVIYEQLDGDDKPKPYIITIDDENQRVLSLYRNWQEGDEKFQELEYIVDFNFIPWRGAYALGLPQIIGGLSDALTGSLRALMDSALISNMAGAVKLKGVGGGGNNTIDPTQVTEIDGLGADDIRKIAMPLPFNQPSPVLFQLLGFLTQQANGVVGTAQEKIADASNQMPVGTALALIEQGAKVFSAIHARLHDSQRRVLEIIHRLNAEHLPEKVQYGSDDQDFVLRADFDGKMDVHPVSDPNIFSEAQRFAQTQAVVQLITQIAPVAPQILQIVDLRALLQRSFEQMKFPDYEEILPPSKNPIPTNPADENVNLVLGKPVKAFEGQDHQAHIQVHLDFGQNQFFGMSPIMPPQFAVGMLNHIQDHILTFYIQQMKLDAGLTLGDVKANMDATPHATEALAKASAVVMKATEMAFGKLPPIIQAALQHIQQNAPKPPQDPMLAIAAQNIQGQQQIAQGKLSLQAQQHRDDMQYKMQILQQKMAEIQNDMALQDKKLGLEQQSELQQADTKAATELSKTHMDNQTAIEIVGMKIASDHASKLRDGMSLSENPKSGE